MMMMLLVLSIIWSEIVYCAYNTWSETTAPVLGYDVLTCDSNCQYIVAGSYYNSVYISSNSGTSWTEITS